VLFNLRSSFSVFYHTIFDYQMNQKEADNLGIL